MKKVVVFSAVMILCLTSATGQNPKGVLKVFSEEPVIVYVDEVHYPDYSNVTLVPGTHYLKAINKDGDKVYSEIVSIKAGQVTSVLIEQKVVQKPKPTEGIVYGQPVQESAPKPPEEIKSETVTEAPPVAKQSIDIGQINGRLPEDMSGAYGLKFGMSASEVDAIMNPRALKSMKYSDYSVYAFPVGSTFYAIEVRFIDHQLFQIIIGYTGVFTVNSQYKIDKKQIPSPEFNNMNNDLVAQYGDPDKTEKICRKGYSGDDNDLLNELKKKRAFMLKTWINPDNGNYIYDFLGYTSSPLAAVIYTSGKLGAQAEQRKIKIHGYDYGKSFSDNYF